MNVDEFFGSKKGGRARGKSSKYVKPPGRPKIKTEPGCTVYDEWNKDKHVYTMFGAPKESCVKCGCEHRMITEWRLNMLKNPDQNVGHPYVLAGFWSLAEYKKFMKR